MIYFLIALLLIIAIILVMAFTGDQNLNIAREITINKPRQSVYDFIKLMGNQKHYSKWVMADPNAKMTMEGTDGTIGAISSWDSQNKQVGKGSQEISSMVEGQRVDWALRFLEPMESNQTASMSLESLSDNQTKVTWTYGGPMKFPMNVMNVILNIKKLLGNELDLSLNNLKAYLENQ